MTWIEDLLEEKNLWRIFLRSPRFWKTRFNAVVIAITFLALAAFACLHWVVPPWAGFLTRFSLHDALLAWSNVGFTYTATMLAFLLAGFTVFSTITKPALFAELAQVQHPNSSLTELKFIFFVFMNVFIHYLAFMILCAVILLFGTPNGPLVLLGSLLKKFSVGTFDILQHTFFVLFGTWFIALLLKLKSFVYSLYSMILVVIVNEGREAK